MFVAAMAQVISNVRHYLLWACCAAAAHWPEACCLRAYCLDADVDGASYLCYTCAKTAVVPLLMQICGVQALTCTPLKECP